MVDSEAKSSVPEDSSSSDFFSSLKGDTGDLNSLTMQQEGINSNTYDLDEQSSENLKVPVSQVTTTRYVCVHAS